MKTKSDNKSLIRRSSVIQLFPEEKKLILTTTAIIGMKGNADTFEEFNEEQVFNLEVVPYEMAMQVICSLINPQKK